MWPDPQGSGTHDLSPECAISLLDAMKHNWKWSVLPYFVTQYVKRRAKGDGEELTLGNYRSSLINQITYLETQLGDVSLYDPGLHKRENARRQVFTQK